MAEWVTVGSVVKIQVAGRRIRNGPVFNPEPLLEMAEAHLSPEGVIGFDGQGWVLDSHHRSHPERTTWKPHRVLLIGFTSNYQQLAQEFRPVPLGVAGENLIVTSEDLVTPERAAGGIRIQNGDTEMILDTVEPAVGCLPFTRFILDRPQAPDADISTPRERLSQGLRGFVAPYYRTDPFAVRPGAQVALQVG